MNIYKFNKNSISSNGDYVSNLKKVLIFVSISILKGTKIMCTAHYFKSLNKSTASSLISGYNLATSFNRSCTNFELRDIS